MSCKVITVVGARPQFIKAAVLSKQFNLTSQSDFPIEEEILHTGQHYDSNMSDQFFLELGIPQPRFHLGVSSGSHGSSTGRMLESIEKVLLQEMPNAVLVYGDTNSTLAGSLAASKLKIPVLHVEAGLRSFNRSQPEEQNRVLTDHLSDLCFAPTDTAVSNLRNEGIPESRIRRTGDIMVDSARIFLNDAENLKTSFSSRFEIVNGPFILATVHRAENTDNYSSLRSILLALSKCPLPVLFPLHPRTKSRIFKYNLDYLLKNILICSPLSFLEMILLEKKSSIIVTDSGGVQKEAYIHSTPCVTVRKETEWIELVELGWNVLADPENPQSILSAIDSQLKLENNTFPHPPIYGDGFASDEIISSIKSFLSLL